MSKLHVFQAQEDKVQEDKAHQVFCINKTAEDCGLQQLQRYDANTLFTLLTLTFLTASFLYSNRDLLLGFYGDSDKQSHLTVR